MPLTPQQKASKARYKERHPERVKDQARKVNQYSKTMRYLAVQKLGGCCEYCGERNIQSLSIDHVNRDGHELRKRFSHQGLKWYAWIVKGKLPTDDLRVLCYNCHMPERWYGFSPIGAMQRLYCGD